MSTDSQLRNMIDAPLKDEAQVALMSGLMTASEHLSQLRKYLATLVRNTKMPLDASTGGMVMKLLMDLKDSSERAEIISQRLDNNG